MIPISTDATVYYRGYSTFAIITANVLLFILAPPEHHQELLTLEFGVLRPWQWVTCTFSHADIGHLAGNMLFLFWFGQIVEGRIGSLRFLLVYLGIGAASGLLTQVLMIGADQGLALGASGVIFGLIVIALVIEPGANITFGWLIWRWFPTYEVRLRSFGLFYVGWNLFWAMVDGFAMSSAALHLLGAVVGLGALYLLRHWDWIYDPEAAQAGKPSLEELRARVKTVAADESPRPAPGGRSTLAGEGGP